MPGITNPLNFTVNATVRAEDVSMAIGDRVFVEIFGASDGVNVKGYFENVPKKSYIPRGSTFNPATLIASELTLLDLVKAAVHLVNGKIETNWDSRTVSLYTPYTVDVYDEKDVEGFFQDDIDDVTEIVLPQTEVVTINREEKKRFLVLQFADSSDPKVESENEGRTYPIYSRVINRGVSFENGREISPNPLFEPTVNAFIDKFPIVPPFVDPNNEIGLPHCWDNEEGNISYDIGYRILYCAGLVTQQLSNGAIRRWRFEFSPMDDTPYAFQVPNAMYDSGNGIQRSSAMASAEFEDPFSSARCYVHFLQYPYFYPISPH